MKPNEFDNMTWGDYSRCVCHYKLKYQRELNQYRNILGALIHKDPRQIIEFPGDYDYIPEPMSQDELREEAIKKGYAHLLGIKTGEC